MFKIHFLMIDDLMKSFLKNPDSDLSIICKGLLIESLVQPYMNENGGIYHWVGLHNINVGRYTSLMVNMLVNRCPQAFMEKTYIRENPDIITLGGMNHDVGKPYIQNPSLLDKVGATEEEKKLIRTHPLEGYFVLESNDSYNNEFPTEIGSIIYSHHEQFSGNGYPSGCDDIPLFLQMVKLADFLDTRTSWRPYQEHEGIKMLNEREAKRFILNTDLGFKISHELLDCFMTLEFLDKKFDVEPYKC